jgi:F-box protein 9
VNDFSHNDEPVAAVPVAGPSRSPRSATVGLGNTEQRPQSKDQALQLYTRAVESEQAGKLNEALMMYRRAFKLDGEARTHTRADADNVDRLYARAAAKAAAHSASIAAAAPDTPSSTDLVSATAPADEPYSFQRHIQVHPDYEKHPPPLGLQTSTTTVPARRSPLTAILAGLPIPADQTQFVAAEEHMPVPIAAMPVELLEPILARLDVASVERFAQTCWRARVVTARSAVWRRIAMGLYKPPAMVPEGWDVRDLNRRHAEEWRTTCIEEERVRMDGCYISVCHYM